MHGIIFTVRKKKERESNDAALKSGNIFNSHLYSSRLVLFLLWARACRPQGGNGVTEPVRGSFAAQGCSSASYGFITCVVLRVALAHTSPRTGTDLTHPVAHNLCVGLPCRLRGINPANLAGNQVVSSDIRPQVFNLFSSFQPSLPYTTQIPTSTSGSEGVGEPPGWCPGGRSVARHQGHVRVHAQL